MYTSAEFSEDLELADRRELRRRKSAAGFEVLAHGSGMTIRIGSTFVESVPSLPRGRSRRSAGYPVRGDVTLGPTGPGAGWGLEAGIKGERLGAISGGVSGVTGSESSINVDILQSLLCAEALLLVHLRESVTPNV